MQRDTQPPASRQVPIAIVSGQLPALKRRSSWTNCSGNGGAHRSPYGASVTVPFGLWETGPKGRSAGRLGFAVFGLGTSTARSPLRAHAVPIALILSSIYLDEMADESVTGDYFATLMTVGEVTRGRIEAVVQNLVEAGDLGREQFEGLG